MGIRKREIIKDFLWFYRRQTVFLCILLTVMGILTAGVTVYGKGADVRNGISGKILRFHVIANSDSEEDQALKLKVRDAVLVYMKELLEGAEDIDETKARVQAHIGQIEEAAAECIAKEGENDPVRAELTECYFPRKSYGDCTFAAGNYQALRVTIGEAAGKNWWCVLFPNLCFVDSIHAVVPEEQKQELQNVLTEEEYESLFDWKESKVKVSSYIGKWFQQ